MKVFVVISTLLALASAHQSSHQTIQYGHAAPVHTSIHRPHGVHHASVVSQPAADPSDVHNPYTADYKPIAAVHAPAHAPPTVYAVDVGPPNGQVFCPLRFDDLSATLTTIKHPGFVASNGNDIPLICYNIQCWSHREREVLGVWMKKRTGGELGGRGLGGKKLDGKGAGSVGVLARQRDSAAGWLTTESMMTHMIGPVDGGVDGSSRSVLMVGWLYWVSEARAKRVEITTTT
ncbi:unnamed protein product [Lepeophtheirus salmonis]|uniref:(salmon louse) hypothetical protein n=1 Tax=Lepeophtheirus salmonis TaxID=72036 RepID=A0A817FB09_LEPSM|nr:unnamed protein product [Lepeophtheirus salmonis]CAG9475447.1 unnamed protein product [Lepeophtheirus salmonis]